MISAAIALPIRGKRNPEWGILADVVTGLSFPENYRLELQLKRRTGTRQERQVEEEGTLVIRNG